MAREVKLNINGKKVTPAEPTPLQFMVGDKIRFKSEKGKVKIKIDAGHGFSADTFSSDGPDLEAVTPGSFKLKCTVELADGTKLGWPDDPASGTDVVIGGGM